MGERGEKGGRGYIVRKRGSETEDRDETGDKARITAKVVMRCDMMGRNANANTTNTPDTTNTTNTPNIPNTTNTTKTTKATWGTWEAKKEKVQYAC